MVPSRERLKTYDALRGNLDERLVPDTEFASVQRSLEIALECALRV
jgi:hypothetical protein